MKTAREATFNRASPLPFLTALFFLIAFLPACSLVTQHSSIPAVASHGHGLLASTPKVKATEDGLLVTGWVTRSATYQKDLPLHVDVEVLNEDGKQVALSSTDFSPNPIPRGHRMPRSAKYRKEIRGNFSERVQVRVTVHPVPLGKCSAQQKTVS
jgi:hypothetical protein